MNAALDQGGDYIRRYPGDEVCYPEPKYFVFSVYFEPPLGKIDLRYRVDELNSFFPRR